MRIVTTPAAAQLTGLSTVTLREWTSRRALIPADVLPKGKGSPAGFTWHTILLLRVAVVLRDRFHFELQPHQRLFASLKSGFQRTSFIALWGKFLVLRGDSAWSIVEEADGLPLSDDAVVIRLEPHLEILSSGFSLPHPAKSPGQLELFPARLIDAPAPSKEDVANGLSRRMAVAVRRRSA
jgi:hypothetical protein